MRVFSSLQKTIRVQTKAENCRIGINVMSGRDEGMTEEQLQELADKIDFSALKDVKEPDMRGDR